MIGEKKIQPLSNVVGNWRPGCGGYPESIRLAMSDGNVVTYIRQIEQPKPARLFRTVENPDGYQPKHAKK